MRDAFSHFFRTDFVDTGRLPLLALLAGMILTFLGIRMNTRLIRRGVRWWPGNWEHGDVHVHHIAVGLPVMFVASVVEIAFRPGYPWAEVVALILGGGAALVFDEYALILHVRDVYWEEEGRQSVEAVFLAIIFTAFLVVGIVPLGGSDPDIVTTASRWSITAVVAINVGFVVTAFLKGKLWMGSVGLFVPVFAWVGALRLARPFSPWVRWFYADKPRKLERAAAREVSYQRDVGRWRRRLVHLVGGTPNAPEKDEHPPHPQP